MRTNWLIALSEAGLDFVIDVCTMLPAAFIGFGLAWNEGKNAMVYVVLGLPFLAIAFIVRAVRHKIRREIT
jgi:hypothetical protein